jgi:hypothetical protein
MEATSRISSSCEEEEVDEEAVVMSSLWVGRIASRTVVVSPMVGLAAKMDTAVVGKFFDQKFIYIQR